MFMLSQKMFKDDNEFINEFVDPLSTANKKKKKEEKRIANQFITLLSRQAHLKKVFEKGQEMGRSNAVITLTVENEIKTALNQAIRESIHRVLERVRLEKLKQKKQAKEIANIHENYKSDHEIEVQRIKEIKRNKLQADLRASVINQGWIRSTVRVKSEL